MCWLTNAWPSTTSVIAFLRSAPSASTGRVDRQRRHRAGRVAAAPPQDHRPAAVRTARPSRPPAGRSAARRSRNASARPASRSQRVLVLVRDRLARAVGAGHDQHIGRAGGEEQMVQRRVREHHAELVVVRGDARQSVAAPAPARSARAADSRAALRPRARARPAPCAVVEVPRHQRERLLLAELPLAQRADGSRVPRVAGEVVAAEALDGEDARRRAAGRPRARIGIGAVRSTASARSPRSAAIAAARRRDTRPAARGTAGSPGRDTRRSHAASIGHVPHRGARPVVGQAQDDRVARAAVGAVDVRVADTAGRRGRTARAGRRRTPARSGEMRAVGCSRLRLARMTNPSSPLGSRGIDVDRRDARGRRARLSAARGGMRRSPLRSPSRWISTPSSPFSTQPARCWRGRAGRRTAGSRRPAPRRARGPCRRCVIARPTRPTVQPRPCQPTCTTAPSSTRTGTVRWAPASARMPLPRRAVRLDVVLDEVARRALQPFAHVAGVGTAAVSVQLNVGSWPSSSRLSRIDVIDRGLDLLDPRDVVRVDDDAVVGQRRGGRISPPS